MKINCIKMEARQTNTVNLVKVRIDKQLILEIQIGS